MRIGDGELEKPESIAAHAQSIFFKILRDIAPEVIQDLKGETYLLYRQTRHVFGDEINFRILFEDERFVELRHSLESWAGRWHLEAQWCLMKAWMAFQWWETGQDDPENYDVDFWESDDWTGKAISLDASATGEEREFVFRYILSDLSFMKREFVEAELRESFERELKAHLDSLEETAKERGFVPVRTKWCDDHFRWLVRYQVQGQSMEKVAREFHVDRITARDGIASAADLIDLRRRDPLPPGRPRSDSARPAS